MRGNRGRAISSFPKASSWTTFSMKMGKHEELKDKQISSQSISFTAIYTHLWIWTLAPPEQLSVWIIGTDLVIIAEHIFSRWVTSPLGSQVDFSLYMSERECCRCVLLYVNKTGCSSSLRGITSARYAVWTVGTDRQKHKYASMAWRMKQNLVRATMLRMSVQCVCLLRVYI